MSRACVDGCGKVVTSGSKSGRCRSCAMRQRPRKPKKPTPAWPRIPCEGGCGRSMADFPRRKTRLCRSCFAAGMAKSEVKRARCRSAMLKKLADPAFKALHCERTKAGTRASLADPEKLAARQANGRRVGLLGLGIQQAGPGHPARVRAGRKRSETCMAWCPPAYRDLYRELLLSGHARAAEARTAVLEQIEADARAVRAGAMVPQDKFIAVRSAVAYLKEQANG